MNIEQKNIIIVNDPKVVKLLEKQLIKKILACFNNSPKTASQISNTVSFPKDKIYYHIKNLIANNILYVVSTKKIKGIDQKEFLPTAKEFKIESVSKSETNNLKYDEKKVLTNCIDDNSLFILAISFGLNLNGIYGAWNHVESVHDASFWQVNIFGLT